MGDDGVDNSNVMQNLRLNILGIRGIPAMHGGFETFAEHLALYLVSRGWNVTVYCQEHGIGSVYESEWFGVRRLHVPVNGHGSASTVCFDWKVAWHARSQPGLFITLGYNTAVFNILQRLSKQANLINMDGIEWRRAKWGRVAKAWFWINERAGCLIGNHLIADHPGIKEHLSTRVRADKITMIPYGAYEVLDADVDLLSSFEIVPGCFSVVIARPEPENSVLEMVSAFSRSRRNHKLVVLGSFDPVDNPYHRRIMHVASDEVIFPGAIYDSTTVRALRFYSYLYLHGHQVGGTNPSLVEAMGAGSAVLAHDNKFNRWVAGEGARYFSDEETCAKQLETLLSDEASINDMKVASRMRFRENFTWDQILNQYEQLLSEWANKEPLIKSRRMG